MIPQEPGQEAAKLRQQFPGLLAFNDSQIALFGESIYDRLRGGVVHIVGQSGIGKSRTAATLCQLFSRFERFGYDSVYYNPLENKFFPFRPDFGSPKHPPSEILTLAYLLREGDTDKDFTHPQLKATLFYLEDKLQMQAIPVFRIDGNPERTALKLYEAIK